VVAVTCEISEETRAARARERSRDPERVSDADAGVAARLAASFEPVGDEPGIALAVRLRTDRPLESTVDELAAALDRAAS
jgi:predicted kinase